MATKDAWWNPTAEELEEERLLQEMLSGGPEPQSVVDPDGDMNSNALTSRSPPLSAATSTRQSLTEVTASKRESRGNTPSSNVGGRGGQTSEGSGVVAGAVRRWGGLGRTTTPAPTAMTEEAIIEDSSGISSRVLEVENRDLVARLKNELDEARLVETKMSEVHWLNTVQFAGGVMECMRLQLYLTMVIVMTSCLVDSTTLLSKIRLRRVFVRIQMSPIVHRL